MGGGERLERLPMMKSADLQPPVEPRSAGRPRWSTAASAMPSARASSGSVPEGIVAGGGGAGALIYAVVDRPRVTAGEALAAWRSEPRNGRPQAPGRAAAALRNEMTVE